MRRAARAITAIAQRDGRLRFQHPRAAKPIGRRLLDWTLALLWFAVAAVFVATALSI